MAAQSYRNALVYQDFSFRRGGFTVEDGRFVQVGEELPDAVDLQGALVLPGLIDIHSHGNSGCDLCDGSYEGLVTMARFYARHGITSFAPASATVLEETLRDAYVQAARLHREQPEEALARLCGEIDTANQELEQIRADVQRIRQIKVCPSCGYENPSDASFCCKCSAALPELPRREEAGGPVCPSCGAPVMEGAAFCTKCGTRLAPPQE